MIGNVNVPGALAADIANKVDKVSGKGLSTEDYTTAEKNKLAELKNYTAGTGITIDNDGTINCTGGTTVDSSFSTTSENPVQNKVINSALANKVDKVSGKGLSTNDFTDADKNAISQFSGLVIDYGTASILNDNNRKVLNIYFNKTFSSAPTVVANWRKSTSSDLSNVYFIRLLSVTNTYFSVEACTENGTVRTAYGYYPITWIAIGT